MYLDQHQYEIKHFLGVVGSYFWAATSLFFSIGLFSSELWEITYFVLLAIFVWLWALHISILLECRKAKFLNGFLENCREGKIELRVLSKAIGDSEEQILKDIKQCQKAKLLNQFYIQHGDTYTYTTLYLKNPRTHMTKIICPHCGGENEVLRGFVHTCSFCGGSLEDE